MRRPACPRQRWCQHQPQPYFRRAPLTNYQSSNSSTIQNDYKPTLNVSYEFDWLGRVRRDVESARASAAQSQADSENVRLLLTPSWPPPISSCVSWMRKAGCCSNPSACSKKCCSSPKSAIAKDWTPPAH
jgi:hypothetical protein